MDLFLYHFYSFSSPIDHVLCDYNYILPVGTVSRVLFDLGAPCVYYVFLSIEAPGALLTLLLSLFLSSSMK